MEKVRADIKKINDYLKNIESEIKKIKDLLNEAGQLDQKEDYLNMPGIEGNFDGLKLVADDGSKYDVPENYAAKTRILFGDRLKLIKDGDKSLYKLINKQPKQKVEGILTKKEGKWYILSPEGSFKISDTAAEFNKAELNDEAIAIIPRGNTTVPFAALDKVKKEKTSENEEKPPVVPPVDNSQKPTPQTAPTVSKTLPEVGTPASVAVTPQVTKQPVVAEKKPPVVVEQVKAPEVKEAPKPPVVAAPKKDVTPPVVKSKPLEVSKPVEKALPPKEEKKAEPKEEAKPKEVSGTINTASAEIEEFDLR